MKNNDNTSTLVKNALMALGDNLACAITTDLPITIAMLYALHDSSKEMPTLESIASDSTLSILLSTGNYFIRDYFRGRMENLDIEKEGAKESIKGGIVAGALKYATSSLFTAKNSTTSSVITYGLIGALNVGLYEATRTHAAKIFNADDQSTLTKLGRFSALYSAIELMSSPLMDIATWYTAADYDAQNSHSDYMQNCFSPNYFLKSVIPATIIGGIITAAAVALVNIPFEGMVRKALTPYAVTYLCCCAIDTCMSRAVVGYPSSSRFLASVLSSDIVTTAASSLTSLYLNAPSRER